MRLPRRARWLLLLAAVLLLHAGGMLWLHDTLVGWGGGEQPPMPTRMEVAFVKALAPAAPPAPPSGVRVAAGGNANRKKPKRTPVPAPTEPASAAASAPNPVAEVASAPPPMEVVEAPPPAPPVTEPAPTAVTPAATSSTTAAASSFDWPPSTRLTYSLVGNYRGEVHGNARVQWVRVGARYQVHMDVEIGPSFAPLIARRMTSDGDLGDDGLAPRRYDEATKLPFQSPRRVTVQFTPGQVTIANGSTVEAPARVQDTASQFVQLTWMFTLQPELLRVGNVIELPLALPRRVDRWYYDVVEQQRLDTPVGALDTFHLRPRRGGERPQGELSAEVWFAPMLQYLPVRIRIQQDADTFIDLVMNAAPLQADADASPR
jgi:hypothetical protein